MSDVLCPAGEAVGEATPVRLLLLRSRGCQCRIEDQLITPISDPVTFFGYCSATRPDVLLIARDGMGLRMVDPADAIQIKRNGGKVWRVFREGYTECPTWRTDKHNTFATRLADKDGDWWQVNEKTGRVEYLDKEKLPGTLEESMEGMA